MDALTTLRAEINRLDFTQEEQIRLRIYFTENVEKIIVAASFLPDFETDDGKRDYLKSLIGELTEQELLRTVVSIPKMHTIKMEITIKVSTRKIPNIPVLEWDDFLANAFYASKTTDTINRRFSRPIVTGALFVEDSVVDLFLKTMETINNQRLILLPTPERWSKRYVFRTVKGQPDAIRCGAGNIQLLNDGNASLILSAVEVKTEQLMGTLVADGTELVAAYNTALTAEDDGTTAYTRHQKIIRIVRQLFGYMVINDLKYGLLTTYIRTWFFYRQDGNEDNIYISPAVHINQSHTGDSASFLECMYYFENISTANSTAHSSSPNTCGDENNDSEDNNDDKDRDKSRKYREKDDDEYRPSSSKKSVFRRTLRVITRSQSKKGKEKLNDIEFLNSMENYKRSQFSFGDVWGNGRSGVIFMTKLHEQVGALKMVDLYKKEYLLQEILNELKMYLGPLKEIQGICIPKLLKYGVLHEAFAFILTSFAGESFANKRNITEKEKQLAIDGLREIHDKGVKHGDIRLENIIMERNELTGHSCVQWIDFAWSKVVNNVGNLKMELFELKHLLGMR
ncbi:6546_t:CDS:2 [Acaulospora morrowiae]|uniref:6546_t:CDS:1 n=1 Tax=Acaulospora morrowiae TaxID=94023 RepID=A0A9N9D2V3_9GLOM|nr:6546_t:CDS:2 [Acaulospora morrowiae]